MFLFPSTVLRRPSRPEGCWEKRDLLLMLLTPRCCKEPSRPTTRSLISLISLGFLIISIGGLMRDIMALWRVWIRQRPPRSTVRSRFLFGEDLMIFHHQSSPLMTRGIQGSLHNIKICQVMHFLAPSHWRSLLIECFLSGMTPFAPQFSTIKTSSW